ncbi:MAG: helix-turn-helix transcriptional regulator [Candidatus Levyibacteriota bacterium]
MKVYITNHVARLRKEKGMTQESFADTIGVSRQTIIAIEKGNYTPSLLLGIKIAQVFKKKVEDVFACKYEN